MKGFNRPNQLFSLCGLNCGLCPMFLNKNCPGCGGGGGTNPAKSQGAAWNMAVLNIVSNAVNTLAKNTIILTTLIPL